MAISYNTALQNSFAGVLQQVFGGETLEIRDASNNVLVSISLPSTAFGSASSGAVSKSGTWLAEATANGTAANFRLTAAGGQELTGSVGGDGSGEDMEITNNISGTADTEIVSGNDVEVTSFTFTQPGS